MRLTPKARIALAIGLLAATVLAQSTAVDEWLSVNVQRPFSYWASSSFGPTTDWSGFAPGSVFLPALILAAGTALSFVPSPWFAVSVVLGSLGILAASVAAFTTQGWETPWLLSLVGFVCGACGPRLSELMLRISTTRAIRNHFEGFLKPDRLRALANEEGRLWLEPGTTVASVLFLDIVGFSILAERRPPHEVLQILRDRYRLVAELVLKWGGVIDKTLGDGLVCFFGLDTSSEANHADQAVGCAVEIQRANALAAAQAGPGHPVFPYRIGIDSAAVVMGDLGAHRRVDFTLIGHGVNRAKRLEGACEPFRVLIGQTTASLLTGPDGLGSPLLPRIVPFKHDPQGTTAIEINPLEYHRSLQAKALAAHRDFAQLERKEDRAAVAPGVLRARLTRFGEGDLVNFSENGFSFRLPTYLGAGLIVDGEIFSQDSTSEPCFPQTLVAEIRWGRPDGTGRFLHGARIQNLTAIQREEFRAALARNNVSRDVRRPRRAVR